MAHPERGGETCIFKDLDGVSKELFIAIEKEARCRACM